MQYIPDDTEGYYQTVSEMTEEEWRRELPRLVAEPLQLVGGRLFRFDLVAWLFGGADSFLSRAVYILVAAAAVWCLTLIFRLDDREAPVRSIG